MQINAIHKSLPEKGPGGFIKLLIMNKIILVLIGMLLINTVNAQKWQTIIGNPGRSDWSGNITKHYDLGYIITGNINEGNAIDHGWLIKTDINGEVLWDKQIALLPDLAIISKTLYDEEGNIYTFGWLKNQNFTHEFPLILKLDACGEKLWCRQLAIDGYSFGFFNDAIFLDNGDLLCLAIMPEDDMSNNNRILLFRMSPDGECIWKKGYATHEDHPYYGDPYGATLNQFGDQYIISGTVYSPYPNAPNPYHVWIRPMFIGISEDFEEQWIVEFGIQDSLLGKAYGTYQLNDSIYMGYGTNRYVENGYITDNSFIMYYNRDGVETGHHIIDGPDITSGINQNFIDDAERIDQEKFLFAAGIGEVYQGCPYSEIIIDTAGNVHNYTLRENTCGGANFVEKTFDDKYTLTCSYRPPNTNYDIMLYKVNENLEQDTLYPGNYTYDSLCRHTIESGIIDLTGCDAITSIGEIPTLDEYRNGLQSIPIKASPNPTSTGEVLLEFENTRILPPSIPPSGGKYPTLQVYNVFGELVHKERVYPHQGATRLNVSQWPAGMYIATIYSNGQVRGKCKVVVE